MAKEEAKAKVVLERTYNVPLRREFVKSPRYKRTNKAVSALRQFIAKHMKSDNVKLGKNLNDALWRDGIKNPPHHVKINVIKDDKGVVRAELVGFEIELEKKQKAKESVAERMGLKQKGQDDLTQKYSPKAKEAKEEEKPEAAGSKEEAAKEDEASKTATLKAGDAGEADTKKDDAGKKALKEEAAKEAKPQPKKSAEKPAQENKASKAKPAEKKE